MTVMRFGPLGGRFCFFLLLGGRTEEVESETKDLRTPAHTSAHAKS